MMAEGIFKNLKALRVDPLAFISSSVTIPWVKTEILENWNFDANHYEPIYWNEALARAGRQLLNEEGACGTYGDANSDYFIDIL